MPPEPYSRDIPRVAVYARDMVACSADAQLHDLQLLARSAGWPCAGQWMDHGSAGARAGTHQPQLDALLQAAAQRRFELVAAWSLDCLGGSVLGVLGVLQKLREMRVDLYLHQQGLHTSAADGRALFEIVGLLSDFEQRRRSERVRVGLERVDRSGHLKAQPARRRIDEAMEARILELRRQGLGILSVARQAGCGVSSVQRVLAARAK
jgi:DNA invertase Pin-like site-specific DNA recombinase